VLLAAVMFALGWVVAGFLRMVPRREGTGNRPVTDREIRSMQAELRVAQKNAEILAADVQSKDIQMAALRESVERFRDLLHQRQTELDQMTATLNDECAKTAELRTSLADKAEASIRAELKARDVETALSVAEAGSSVVHDEFSGLQAEKRRLEAELRELKSRLGDATSGNSTGGKPPAGYAADF